MNRSRLQDSKFYWLIKKHKDALLFYFHRFWFGAREEKEKVNRFRQILLLVIRQSLLTFIVAVILVLFLNYIESYLVGRVSLWPTANTALSSAKKFISTHPSEVTNLFSTSASIVGVFLGLYFTAVSMVAQAIFATAPVSLREAYLSEKVSNSYIKILSFIACLSILLLFMTVTGKTPGLLNTGLVTIGLCFSVLIFVRLGMRVFSFFNPAELSQDFYYSIKKSVLLATSNGFNYRNRSFQIAYRKCALSGLKNIEALIKLSRESERAGTQNILVLSQYSIGLLRGYQKEKISIPTKSLWFKERPKFANWFLMSSSAVSLYLNTHTGDKAEEVRDLYWLERSIMKTVLTDYNNSLENNDLIPAVELIDCLNDYLRDLGYHLDVEFGLEILNRLKEMTDSFIAQAKNPDLKNEEHGDIGLFDYYTLSWLSLMLGVNDRVRELKKDNFKALIEKVNWADDKSAYNLNFPSVLRPQIDYLAERISFERKVEKKITPSWYGTQLLHLFLNNHLHKTYNDLLTSFDVFFSRPMKNLLEQESYIYASKLGQRGLEGVDKISAVRDDLKEVTKGLSNNQILTDLKFEEWDWDNFDQNLNTKYDDIITQLADTLFGLSKLSNDDSLPDFFGGSYTFVCQHYYGWISEGKFKPAKTVLSKIFISALKAHQKLLEDFPDFSPEHKIHLSSEPILDILSLSGYTKLYAELYNDQEIWEEMVRVWDAYLQENGHEKIPFLINLYRFRKGKFSIFERDVYRTNWQLSFLHALRERGYIDTVGYLPFEDANNESDPVQNHPSPLIRSLCKGGFEPLEDAIEIFIVFYLLEKLDTVPEGLFDDRHEIRRNYEQELNNAQ